MKRHYHGQWKQGAILIALLLPFLLPAKGFAETLLFKNDTKETLVVQVATVIRGAVRRGPPTTLLPGDKMRVNVLGNKLVHVYNARFPNRVLFQGTLTASTEDAAYSINQPDLHLAKVEVERVRPAAMKPRR